MNELHLFAGAGGGILGGMLLGHTPVCAVEIEEYPRKVLLQRQRDGVLPWFPIWDDITTFDGRPWRGLVDIVAGGFPCQDISAAGKGAGIDGQRSGLWGEMARVIDEVRPRYVLVENSPILTSRGLGRVLGDLATLGYDARWGVLGAVDAGAPHKRDRIWIVADSNQIDWRSFEESGQLQRPACRESACDCSGAQTDVPAPDNAGQCSTEGQSGSPEARDDSWRCGEVLADTQGITERTGLCQGESGEERGRRSGDGSGQEGDVADADSCLCQRRPDDQRGQAEGGALAGGRCPCMADAENEGNVRRDRSMGAIEVELRDAGRGEEDGGREWWAVEPDVGRLVNGLASRVDRLKALGNGQVPAVAALAWRILSGEVK